MKYMLLVIPFLFINGCGAKVIASTDKQVMIGNASPNNMDSCLKLAEKECQKHNKHAVFVPANLGYEVAGYSCVSK
jgi:hypothetical protein